MNRLVPALVCLVALLGCGSDDQPDDAKGSPSLSPSPSPSKTAAGEGLRMLCAEVEVVLRSAYDDDSLTLSPTGLYELRPRMSALASRGDLEAKNAIQPLTAALGEAMNILLERYEQERQQAMIEAMMLINDATRAMGVRCAAAGSSALQ